MRYKETFTFRVCSQYQRRSEGPKSNRAMRVNCEYDRVYSDEIRIVFTNLNALGFNLAEIEIHSLGEFLNVPKSFVFYSTKLSNLVFIR